MDENNWIEFEDDYFENKERKVAKENITFSPIICHPKWFFNNELESAETVQNQANFCYWTKDYSSAATLYQKAIDNYFQNSQFMKRNLLESIARCHLQLGGLARAQDLAEECMTFLLKEQSKLCYEMEQLSMQRLLDGQILGASNRQQLPDLKVNTQLLGIRDGEKDGTMMVHGKDGMNGSQQCPPSPTQFSMDSGANSREEFLEGLVEQNARELAELKSLLKAILTPSNKNDVH